jgi:hypothetical protein
MLRRVFSWSTAGIVVVVLIVAYQPQIATRILGGIFSFGIRLLDGVMAIINGLAG